MSRCTFMFYNQLQWQLHNLNKVFLVLRKYIQWQFTIHLYEHITGIDISFMGLYRISAS